LVTARKSVDGEGRHCIRFLFDYISPNAYIAWTQIHELARRTQASVEPVPVLFAALLTANRLSGPAEVPAKWRWMMRDILRKAARLDISLRPPASHPFNPLLPLRASCTELEDGIRKRLIDGLFEAIWVESRRPDDPDVVAVVATRIGIDGEALIASAQSADVKRRLRRQTDEALAQGVFGVPTMIVGDELFWGYDDFVHLETTLEGRGSFQPNAHESWDRVRPTANRRR
jgi:2-hydroxychromene-2-carboxylate isomerase